MLKELWRKVLPRRQYLVYNKLDEVAMIGYWTIFGYLSIRDEYLRQGLRIVRGIY